MKEIKIGDTVIIIPKLKKAGNSSYPTLVIISPMAVDYDLMLFSIASSQLGK
ncbi:hypothetical protein MTP04_36680 [Lysinibacillus sp. PLM2]|nr:hypothetical protein MTP04_36680 [Lysinibacillus sp. PLM2]